MSDRRIILTDGVYNVKHHTKTLSTTRVDLLAEMFTGTTVPDITHVRIIVTNDAAARFKINNCVTAVTADAGMYANQSKEIELRMHVDKLEGVRTGSTDANCEITVWW